MRVQSRRNTVFLRPSLGTRPCSCQGTGRLMKGYASFNKQPVTSQYVCITLDELLAAIIDLVPHEVELCVILLQAMRVSGRFAKVSLDKEVVDVYKALTGFLEAQGGHKAGPSAVLTQKLAKRVKKDVNEIDKDAHNQNNHVDPTSSASKAKIKKSSSNMVLKHDSAKLAIPHEHPDKIKREATIRGLSSLTLPLPEEAENGAADEQALRQNAMIIDTGLPPAALKEPLGSIVAVKDTMHEVRFPEADDDVSSETLSYVSEERGGDPKSLSKLPWFPCASHGDLRRRFFLVLEDPSLSVLGKFMAGFIMLTVAVSTVTFVLESEDVLRHTPAECADRLLAGLPLTRKACEPQPDDVFYTIEVVCIAIFTLEYVSRMMLAHSDAGSQNKCYHTLLYSKSVMNIVDLLAIMPFYIDLAIGGAGSGAMAFVRVLRLARILRLFKMAKHHPGIRMFSEVMVMSGQPLLLLLFFNVIIVVLFGSLLFFAENQSFSIAPVFTQPSQDSCNGTVPASFPRGVMVRNDQGFSTDEETPFRSIPIGLWWVCVAMTTVGYGDMSPTTRLGKALGILCFYTGIIFLALPIGVLSTNFEMVYKKHNPQEVEQRVFRSSIAEVNKRLVPELEGRPFLPSWRRHGFRKAIFLILEDPLSSTVSHWFSVLMTTTILTSTVSFILESMPDFQYVPDACTSTHLSVDDCKPRPDPFFYQLEVVCVIIFSLDYFLRIATVHSVYPHECGLPAESQLSPAKQTFRYAIQWLNLIDFMAIAPFYGELIFGGGGGIPVLRVLRLIRVFRLLKAPKLRVCADMFVNVLMDAAPALLTLLFITTMTCVLFASCIHFAEGTSFSVDADVLVDHPRGAYVRPTTDGYGTEASPYKSIAYAFWWFFVTATTVGFGDDYPTTTMGRCIGIVTFYLGIILLSLPLSIVGGSFNKFYPDWVKEFAHHNQEARRQSQRQSINLDSDCTEPNDRTSSGGNSSTVLSRASSLGSAITGSWAKEPAEDSSTRPVAWS